MRAFLDRLLGRPQYPLSPATTEEGIFGHLFGHAGGSVPRDLFWTIRIGCAPVRVKGRELDCLIAIEWLTWDLRDWKDLDGRSLQAVRRPEMVAASLYLGGQRHAANLQSLEMTCAEGAVFDVHVQGSAVIQGLPRIRLEVESSVNFTGIFVRPDGPGGPPLDAAGASRAVANFIDLYDLHPAERQDQHFVLAPRLDPDHASPPEPPPPSSPRGAFSVLRQVASVEHGAGDFRLCVAPPDAEEPHVLPLEFGPHRYHRGRKLEALAPGDWVEVSGEWSRGEEPAILNLRIRGPIVRSSTLQPGRQLELTATFRDYVEERMNTYYLYLDDWDGEGAELAPHHFLEYDWGDSLGSGDRIRVSAVVAFNEFDGFHLKDMKVLGLADPGVARP